MKLMYSIVYGYYTDTINQKLDTLPEFAPIKQKQDHESDVWILEIIKSICYNFESEKNKVMEYIQSHKKPMRWWKSEVSTITE